MGHGKWMISIKELLIVVYIDIDIDIDIVLSK